MQIKTWHILVGGAVALGAYIYIFRKPRLGITPISAKPFFGGSGFNTGIVPPNISCGMNSCSPGYDCVMTSKSTGVCVPFSR